MVQVEQEYHPPSWSRETARQAISRRRSKLISTIENYERQIIGLEKLMTMLDDNTIPELDEVLWRAFTK